VMVPEGRRIFADQTVMDNLFLGAYQRGGPMVRLRDAAAEFLGRFPVLRERQRSLAGALSGGQQQMLAMARGLMGAPKLLMLDEPSLGLAPRMVHEVFGLI